MKYKATLSGTVVLILWCSAIPVHAVQVKSLTFCREVKQGTKPEGVCKDFASDAPTLHAVAALEDVEAHSSVRGAWISVDAINVPNYEIDALEVEIEADGQATAHSSLSRPANGWPPGNYKIVLSVDGEFLKSFPFSIQAQASNAAQVSAATAANNKSSEREDLEKKLLALEQARQAGILSQEEYARKKAGLQAQIIANQSRLDHATHRANKSCFGWLDMPVLLRAGSILCISLLHSG